MNEATDRGKTVYGCCGVPGEGPHICLSAAIKDGTCFSIEIRTHPCLFARYVTEITSKLIIGRRVEGILDIDVTFIKLLVREVPPGKEYVIDLLAEAIRKTFK